MSLSVLGLWLTQLFQVWRRQEVFETVVQQEPSQFLGHDAEETG